MSGSCGSSRSRRRPSPSSPWPWPPWRRSCPVPVARQMVRRIREMVSATHLLASGKFDTRVSGDSSDELGQLARDFNSLALTLEKNEAARRQWVADISHELRTPLSVLRGEIEAFQDGVREATPQAIGALHGEVMKLGRLVNDLYELSLSDLGALTYRRTDTDLARLLLPAIDPYRKEFDGRGILLEVDVPAGRSFPMFADPDRLHELFSNLLENSLKYTEGGGRLKVRVKQQDRGAAVLFRGFRSRRSASELPRLFDRLYRVEGSRSRATAASGLGLAIVPQRSSRRMVVQSSARPRPLGGLRVEAELPAARRRMADRDPDRRGRAELAELLRDYLGRRGTRPSCDRGDAGRGRGCGRTPSTCVLLDLMLPGKSGLDVCKALRTFLRRRDRHGDGAGRGDRPAARAGARRRRLHLQAVQPARGRGAGEGGAAARRSGRARPAETGLVARRSGSQAAHRRPGSRSDRGGVPAPAFRSRRSPGRSSRATS